MRILILSILFNLTWFSLNGQTLNKDSSSKENLLLITKNDGGEYIGEIISDDGREILIVTKSIGKLFINKSEIKSITKVNEKISERKNGEFRSSGPFTTRYYFTNNALPIKKMKIMHWFMYMDLKYISVLQIKLLLELWQVGLLVL